MWPPLRGGAGDRVIEHALFTQARRAAVHAANCDHNQIDWLRNPVLHVHCMHMRTISLCAGAARFGPDVGWDGDVMGPVRDSWPKRQDRQGQKMDRCLFCGDASLGRNLHC